MVDSDSSTTPVAPPPPAPPQTLGQVLQAARLAHDLTLEQLSTELRIEARQLRALEENRLEQIGVPVFVKGYLKQYGQRLGLDVSDLLALYYKQTTLADVEVQPSRTIKLRDERQIASWILAAIVLLLVIAGLGVWWWNGGDFGAISLPRSTTAPLTSAPPEIAVPQPAEEQPPPPAPAAAEGAPTRVDTAAAAPNDAPAPVLPIAIDAPAGDDRAVSDFAIPIELTFDAESWAEVTDARGERLLFGLYAPGRRVAVRGEPPFAIVLGNANAVHLTVDREPYAIPRRRDGEPARFSVDVSEE